MGSLPFTAFSCSAGASLTLPAELGASKDQASISVPFVLISYNSTLLPATTHYYYSLSPLAQTPSVTSTHYHFTPLHCSPPSLSHHLKQHHLLREHYVPGTVLCGFQLPPQLLIWISGSKSEIHWWILAQKYWIGSSGWGLSS